MFQFPDEVTITVGFSTLTGSLSMLKDYYARATDLIVPEEFEPQYNGQLDLALVMMPELVHLEIYCPVYSLPPLVSVTHLVIPDLRMEQLPPMPELVCFEERLNSGVHRHIVKVPSSPTYRHSIGGNEPVAVRYDEEWKNLSHAEMVALLPDMHRYLRSESDTIISQASRMDLVMNLDRYTVEQYRNDLAAALVYAEVSQAYHNVKPRQ